MLLRISREQIDAIKARTDLAALVAERGIELQRKGRNLFGLCPFHRETSASFVVTPHRGPFHCFGCGVAGDVDDTARADPDFDAWRLRWESRRAREPQSTAEAVERMRAHNPAFVPRNHKVEEALDAAAARQDFTVMERLLDVLRRPYDYTADLPEYSRPSPDAARYVTFCGT